MKFDKEERRDNIFYWTVGIIAVSAIIFVTCWGFFIQLPQVEKEVLELEANCYYTCDKYNAEVIEAYTLFSGLFFINYEVRCLCSGEFGQLDLLVETEK